MKLVKKLKTSFEIKMSHDKRLLCHIMGGKTVVYNTETWEKVVELPKPKNPGEFHFSKNDDFLFIKNTVGTFCVYDTKDFQMVKTIKSRKSFQIVEGNFSILDNEPFTVLDVLKLNDRKQICTLNIETGEHHVLTELDGAHLEFHQFIPNEGYYLFTHYYLKEMNGDHYSRQKLVMVKNPLTEPSYSIVSPLELTNWDLVYFDSTHRVFIFVLSEYEVVIMDGNLKSVLRNENLLKKGLNNLNEYFIHIHVSNDGKYIALTSSERVIILNFDDLSLVISQDLEYACFAEFSKNDEYLLVGTWSNGFVFENNLK